MNFTPHYQEHPLFKSNQYLELEKKFKNNKLKKHILNSEKLQLILSIINQNNKLKTIHHLKYLEKELSRCLDYHKDFENKFLIYEEIISFYKNKNLFCNIGRASSGGSMICFGLNITKIDPLEYDLSFERFIQKDKEIDIDIDVSHRNLIIEYLQSKYKDQFFKIQTKSQYKIKSAIGEILGTNGRGSHSRQKISMVQPAKSNKHYYSFIDNVSSYVEISSKKNNEVLNSIEESEVFQSLNLDKKIKMMKDLKNIFPTQFDLSCKNLFKEIVDQYPKMRSYFQDNKDSLLSILDLMGKTNKYGYHAGGFVLSDNINEEYIHQGRNSYGTFDDNKVVLIDELEHHDNEKIDILSLNIMQDFNEWKGEFSDSLVSMLLNSPEVKDKVFYEINNADIDVYYFQMKPNFKKYLKDNNIKINSILDLAKMTSYYRPGPMRKYDYYTKQIDTPNRFKSFFVETNGHPLFQEDLMKVGILIDEDPIELLKDFARQKDYVIEKYSKKLSEEEMNFLWDYSCLAFNKSHAVSYSIYTYLSVVIENFKLKELLPYLL